AGPGAPRQLLEQAGLADARLSDNLHEPRPAGPEAVQAPVELSQLGFPADQDTRSLADGWHTIPFVTPCPRTAAHAAAFGGKRPSFKGFVCSKHPITRSDSSWQP